MRTSGLGVTEINFFHVVTTFKKKKTVPGTGIICALMKLLIYYANSNQILYFKKLHSVPY